MNTNLCSYPFSLNHEQWAGMLTSRQLFKLVFDLYLKHFNLILSVKMDNLEELCPSPSWEYSEHPPTPQLFSHTPQFVSLWGGGDGGGWPHNQYVKVCQKSPSYSPVGLFFQGLHSQVDAQLEWNYNNYDNSAGMCDWMWRRLFISRKFVIKLGAILSKQVMLA